MNAPFNHDNVAKNAISARLYNGAELIVRGDFGSKKHAYKNMGTGYFIPGVTSILGILAKDALLPWAAGQAALYVKQNLPIGATAEQIAEVCDKAKGHFDRVKEAAGDIGSAVHNYAENLFRGHEVTKPADPQAEKGVNALLEWISENKVRPIEVERICFSRDAFYAGTMDLLADVNGKLTYVDLKTGKGIYKEHLLQAGAYKFAWEEEHREQIEQIIILNCNKLTGSPKIATISDPDEMEFYVDTFLREKSASDNLKKMKEFY